MIKRIKKAMRGLTFQIKETDTFKIGGKYRYYIEKITGNIIVLPDSTGSGNTISRKKVGNNFRPLFDIRSAEVKRLVSDADYLEVEVLCDKIIVYTCKKSKSRSISNNIVCLEDIVGKRTGEIILDKAVGFEFGRPTLANDEYFAHLISQIPSYVKPGYKKEIKQNIEKVYTVASLFSGAGLLDYPFKKDPRFQIIFGTDFDKDAVETYAYNICENVLCKDIRALASSEVPDTDIIIGGPCCQGFSQANRHLDNLNGEVGENKRQLIDEYVRIVKEKNVSCFCIENVPQILSRSQGSYLETICNNLPDYEITTSIVIDCEVGGYTKRKRAIIIGSKIGKIELPSLKVVPMKTVRDALLKVDCTWFNYDDVTKPSEETKRKMSFVPQGGNWKDIPKQLHTLGPHTHSDIYRRLAMDEQSPTITNWRKNNLTHPTENRILNVSEAAALTGLDKEFHFLGSSLNSKQQQVGNGVPYSIANLCKNAIKKALDAFYLQKCKTV